MPTATASDVALIGRVREADAAARITKALGDPAGLRGSTAEIGDTVAGRL